MARGWESKSVESQQTEEPLERESRVSETDLEKLRKREGLELSRTRIRRELETATAPTHRQALEHALAYLEGELKKS